MDAAPQTSGSSRWFRLGTVALLGVAVLTGACRDVATAAQAGGSCAADLVTQPDGSVNTSAQDVDNDGRSDLAVGVPTATSGSTAGAGVVDVHFAVVSRHGFDSGQVGGRAPRAAQRVGESYFGTPAAAGDHFGAAAAIVDADGNHCEDLAVGAPGADAGSGRVLIALGSRTGLSPSGATQLTAPASGGGFGAAVAARGSDLWVGAPDQTVHGAARAGAVYHYRLAAGRVTLLQTLVQGSPGVGGTPEPGDHFGAVLAVDSDDTVAIGVPDEDVGTAVDAGLVSVVRTSASTHLVTHGATFTQNTASVSGIAEKGDHFGASVAVDGDDVLVGVPGEDIGPIRDAGVVHVLQVRSSGALTQRAVISQNTSTVSGTPETADRFGAAVLLDVVAPDDSVDDIVVSAPGESLGRARSAGVVTVLHVAFHDNGSLTITQKLPDEHQGSPGGGDLGGIAETGDSLGAGLSSVAVPYWADSAQGADRFVSGGAALVIATPGEDVGSVSDAGVVSVVGRPACRPGCGGSPGAVTYEDSAGASAGERYGVGASTVSTSAVTTD